MLLRFVDGVVCVFGGRLVGSPAGQAPTVWWVLGSPVGSAPAGVMGVGAPEEVGHWFVFLDRKNPGWAGVWGALTAEVVE